MDLQKWMTRFQLTGNRLIESWMDLIPDLLISSPEAIQYVQTQRQDHERDQNERAQVAAATPGEDPHVVIPWTDEMALVAFRQLNDSSVIQIPLVSGESSVGTGPDPQYLVASSSCLPVL